MWSIWRRGRKTRDICHPRIQVCILSVEAQQVSPGKSSQVKLNHSVFADHLGAALVEEHARIILLSPKGYLGSDTKGGIALGLVHGCGYYRAAATVANERSAGTSDHHNSWHPYSLPPQDSLRHPITSTQDPRVRVTSAAESNLFAPAVHLCLVTHVC
jgi:hypothetical protein